MLYDNRSFNVSKLHVIKEKQSLFFFKKPYKRLGLVLVSGSGVPLRLAVVRHRLGVYFGVNVVGV